MRPSLLIISNAGCLLILSCWGVPVGTKWVCWCKPANHKQSSKLLTVLVTRIAFQRNALLWLDQLCIDRRSFSHQCIHCQKIHKLGYLQVLQIVRKVSLRLQGRSLPSRSVVLLHISSPLMRNGQFSSHISVLRNVQCIVIHHLP